jgi:uncharacterized membrane protein
MSASGLRHLVPEPVRRTPADLALVVLSILLTGGAVFLPGVRETVVRVVLGAAFVLFVPGYAFVAALFPGGPSKRTLSEGETATEDALLSDGIGGVERFTLSVGTSIATVIVLGLVLELTPWRIDLGSTFAVLSLFTFVVTVVAAVRRRRLPTEERFRAPIGTWYRTVRDGFLEPETRMDGLLNVALVIGLVVAVWSVGYAAVDPNDGALTELYLLTEQEDGELAARGYPTDLAPGEAAPLVVGVSNEEGERTRYSLVVELQSVAKRDNATRVVRERELRRESLILPHNETRLLTDNVTLQETGRYRVSYLLYRETPPAEPTLDNAYREVHLWINVSVS